MRSWWREIAGLVLPVACGGCGRPRTELCEECAGALAAVPRRVRPVPEPAGLPMVHAAAPYENAVRATLLAHKERGALGLAGALGGALAAAVRAGAGHVGDAGPLLLVPVPSSPRATAARGHDPARRIALAAAAALRRGGVAARVLAVLGQRRAVADQAGLKAGERHANLAGALAVADGGRRLLQGARIVLVDDVLTTGSSLAEAARAVRAVRGADRADGSTAEPLRAAVVAASPSAFELNRN
ncbi:ComF family protein [Streptomyces sp. NPDC056465]|uniref:ComF family protein n=1 Tax=unclassified Streptomyces TaxID=2593676 RepID=UPI0035E1F2C4